MKNNLLKTIIAFIAIVTLSFTPTFAQKVFVPDDAFETFLIAKGYDNVLDDSVLLSNISTVKTLVIPPSNIKDLTGIEWFIALEDLKCTGNRSLSTFKLNSGYFSQLINLNLSDNGLNSIDIPYSSQISTINLSKNVLTTIDLSKFTALKFLDLSYNQLTEISFSKNNALQKIDVSHNLIINNFSTWLLNSLNYLNCSFNNITTVGYPKNLEYLDCSYNQITYFSNDHFGNSGDTLLRHLNISNNNIENLVLGKGMTKYLTNIYAQNNKLTSCSVEEGLYNRIAYFDIRNNPSLYCIATAVPYMMKSLVSGNKVFIDANTSFSTDCARTYMPDDAFEQYMLTADIDSDGMLNDYVYTVDLANKIYTLDVPKNKIKDLTGVKGCTNMTQIYFNSDTLLKTIDLSGMKKLERVLINDSRLENIDVSGATNLKNLTAYNCKLTSVNLDGADSLVSIDLAVNNLKSIDVFNLPKLQTLKLRDNKIESLDVSNVSLTTLTCHENPNLYCITVGDSAAAAVNFQNILWIKDKQARFGTVCTPEIYIPIVDTVFEKALITAKYDNILDGRIRLKNAEQISSLNLTGMGVSDVSGIEYFTNIVNLFLGYNSIKSINLNGKNSSNPQARVTGIVANAGLFKLSNLNISNNLISELDLSGLEDLKNGYVDLTNNPNLTCINVSDVDVAKSNTNWVKDTIASYSLNCLTGLDDLQGINNSKIIVYPNPAASSVNITLEYANNAKLEVFDSKGLLLINTFLNEMENNIEIGTFGVGIYLFKVTTNTESYTQKVVVE